MARRKADKEFKAETRKRKAGIKKKPEYTKEAQISFNKFIRLRDHDKDCISCDKQPNKNRRYLGLTGGVFDCGHYRSVGSAPELRFEELNAYKQCKYCNNHLSGNIVEYRLGLIKRISAEDLIWLEGPHEPKKYTIDDLKEIRNKYNTKARELQREIDNV